MSEFTYPGYNIELDTVPFEFLDVDGITYLYHHFRAAPNDPKAQHAKCPFIVGTRKKGGETQMLRETDQDKNRNEAWNYLVELLDRDTGKVGAPYRVAGQE